MYKFKYLKYKEKYLKLKKNMKGGMPLKDILYRFDLSDFVKWYQSEIQNKNEYQIFLELLNQNQNQNQIPNDFLVGPFNILVGATNSYDNDYFRFKDSNIYSLYINTKVSKEPDRQYKMYTVNFNDISPNILSFRENYVNQIHFDTQVSYFCPINYLHFAEHVLLPGGKIIFDLAQHGDYPYFYDGNIFSNKIDKKKSKDELELEHNVIIDMDRRTILPSINYLGVYANGYIDPQLRLTIVEYVDSKFIPFNKDPYRGYLQYCSEKYSQLRFEEKTYTFSNYIYPVPIRTVNENLEINLCNETIDFIGNKVMTLDERRDYINNKIITDDLTSNIISRITENNNMKLEFYTHTSKFTEILKTIDIDTTQIIDEQIGVSNDIIGTFIKDELNKPFKFIEGTKK
jgi:hypothetical protein